MSETKAIHLYPVGMALGIFLSVSFAVCVLLGLLLPGAMMYEAWLPWLPGVTWISWPSALLGLAESFAYGWYITLLFVPLYNLFAKRA